MLAVHHSDFYISILCIQILACGAMHSSINEVHVGVLLPDVPYFYFSMNKVIPAIKYAFEALKLKVRPNITYADSKCQSQYTINELFNLRAAHGELHVIFGPVCDYCLSPVSKQLLFWNIPVITTGGLAKEFTDEKTTSYSMLTRVGVPGMEKISEALGGIFSYFDWHRHLLLYDRDGQDMIIYSFCHFFASAVHYEMRHFVHLTQHDFFKFVPHQKEGYMKPENFIKDEIGNKYTTCNNVQNFLSPIHFYEKMPSEFREM